MIATGNCFMMALQIIYDHSTPDDPFDMILPHHNHKREDFDFSTLRLIHGSAIMKSGRRNHAWIELDGYIIDYSNNLKDMVPEKWHREKNHIKIAISLEREQALALLCNDPEFRAGFYWGGYTQDELDRIFQEYTLSTWTWVSRNFLEELENDQRQPHE